MMAMQRSRSHIARCLGGALAVFVSALLVVQTALATHGASAATEAGVTRIVICGAGGVTTITIAADGTRSVEQGDDTAAAQCPFGLVAMADVAACGLATMPVALPVSGPLRPACSPHRRIVRVDPARAIRAPPATA